MSAFSAILAEYFFFAVATTSSPRNTRGRTHCNEVAANCSCVCGTPAIPGGRAPLCGGPWRSRSGRRCRRALDVAVEQRAQIVEAARAVADRHEISTPTPPARAPGSHSEQMARHRAQRRARGELARNVLLECREHGRLADWRTAVETLVEPREQPRVLISGSADHD